MLLFHRSKWRCDIVPPLAQELTLEPFKEDSLTILYDSTYCRNKYSCYEDKHLKVTYKEHSQRVHTNETSLQVM